METINAKNVFLFSIAGTLIFACYSTNIYFKKLNEEKELNKKIEREKKERMDDAYKTEFYGTYAVYLQDKNNYVTVKFYFDEIEKIESKMRKDGYDFGQIKAIKSSGIAEARKEAREYKKWLEENK